MKPISFFACVLLILEWGLPTRADDAQELVAGAIARSRAVTSGRLKYTYRTKNPVNKTGEVRFSFSGESSAQRYTSNHNVTVNHGGYSFHYSESPQPMGKLDKRAAVKPPVQLAEGNYLNKPPIFAGSFWLQGQRDWVEIHDHEFHLVGTKKVNSIDVIICEADITAEEGRRGVFQIYHPRLENGGVLRLSIAPHLGYVLAAVEVVTPEGFTVTRFGASNFAEKAPGIYFPSVIDWDFADEEEREIGPKSSRGECEIASELINQPIPEKDFEIVVPAGTILFDIRVSRKNNIFVEQETVLGAQKFAAERPFGTK